MKRIFLFSLFCLLLLLSCATGKKEEALPSPPVVEDVDWAGKLEYNENSNSAKVEVTVKSYIDGDTVHFNVPENVVRGGILKARFLAVNTPESTGKIEEWGKAASRFTKEKLMGADSIIVESDDGTWNLDSTGSRYLVWVWYRTRGEEKYRCLNLELLQSGLAIPSSSANNRYGSWCQNAISTAKNLKKCIWSGAKDPDFFYGDAVEVTLKELRTNIEAYDSVKVAFEGVVIVNSNNSVYVEAWDEETGCPFGIPVYYGYSLSGTGLEILQSGNRVRIVGSVQYYAAGGSYQISGLKYREMKPDDPSNIRLIEKSVEILPFLVSPLSFNGESVEVESGDEVKTIALSDALQGTLVEMEGVLVEDIYTTDNRDSSSFGAMTMVASRDGERVTVRTMPLYENGRLLTEEDFMGKEISFSGVVGTYDGKAQIQVFRPDDITVR